MNFSKPKRCMCVIREYTPEEILALRGDKHVLFYCGDFPYDVHMDDSRYRVFAKSLECCACGLKGTVMRLEYNWHPKGWIEPHFNLYARNTNGTYVLMTQDHIIPKSKGGSSKDENLRTMCAPCNEQKGSKYAEAGRESLSVGSDHSQKGKVRLEGILDNLCHYLPSGTSLHSVNYPVG